MLKQLICFLSICLNLISGHKNLVLLSQFEYDINVTQYFLSPCIQYLVLVFFVLINIVKI